MIKLEWGVGQNTVAYRTLIITVMNSRSTVLLSSCTKSHQTNTRPVPAPVKGKKGKNGCIRHDDGDNDVGKEEENSDEEEAEGEDRA